MKEVQFNLRFYASLLDKYSSGRLEQDQVEQNLFWLPKPVEDYFLLYTLLIRVSGLTRSNSDKGGGRLSDYNITSMGGGLRAHDNLPYICQ